VPVVAGTAGPLSVKTPLEGVFRLLRNIIDVYVYFFKEQLAEFHRPLPL
jgi:hypothetical protein